MKKQIAMLLSLVMILSLFAGCGNDKPAASEAPKAAEESKAADATNAPVKPVVIKYSTAESPTSVLAQVMTDLIAEVDEKSNGTIIFEPYYSNELGSLADVTEQMTLGGNLMANASGDFYATYGCPDILSSALFYAVPDKEALQKLNASDLFASWCDQIEEASGIKILCCNWAAAPRNIISTKPINSVADIKGLKIRVPAVELQLAAFRSWGVEPHPLAWSETFNGLQQGVVDGQENPHAINRDQKFWEVQKYITNIHYMLWVGPMLVSDPWFRRLDPQTKALVEKAAKEAAAYEWKWSAEQDEIALKECLARGMVINDVSDEPAWTEAARSVWPQFYDKVGGKAVVEEALAIMQQ